MIGSRFKDSFSTNVFEMFVFPYVAREMVGVRVVFPSFQTQHFFSSRQTRIMTAASPILPRECTPSPAKSKSSARHVTAPFSAPQKHKFVATQQLDNGCEDGVRMAYVWPVKKKRHRQRRAKLLAEDASTSEGQSEEAKRGETREGEGKGLRRKVKGSKLSTRTGEGEKKTKKTASFPFRLTETFLAVHSCVVCVRAHVAN